MEFGWISLFGAVTVILMIVPNIIFALRNRKNDNDRNSIPLLLGIAEQIGRYGCIILMWMPLFVWKFGFGSVEEMVIYILFNGIMTVAYWTVWMIYFRNRTLINGMLLSVIPALIFLVSGILLRHWLLSVFAVVFGVSHCIITGLTHKK